MAELNTNEEPNVLPPKRKQASQTLDDDSTKKLRPDIDTEPPAAVEQKAINENGEKDEIKDEIEEEEEEEDYEGEDELDSEDDDEEEDEHLNGGDEIEIDRKGKGIMKDDKGKGKMIEESEDDDSDSDEDDGGASESDGDDDFSDDPLAEVDLDNILPSRTRRRTAPQGVRISGDDKDNDA